MPATYSKRENAFETGDHVWRVEDDCLVWTRPSGDSLTLPWKDVGAVRAAFAPTRCKTWRHVFELKTRRGNRLLIDNAHFKGVGDFEDRSPIFVAFVLACLDRVIDHAPDARASTGSGPAVYFSQLSFMLAMTALLAWVLLVLPTPPGWLIMLKLLLMAAMLPVVFSWAVRSRPRRVALTHDSLLPGLPTFADNPS